MRRKSAEEVEAIREVAEATEAAMAGVVEYLRLSEYPTSEGARLAIETTLEEYDCELPLGSIVSHGKESADPHAKGSGGIEGAVPVVIDIYPRSKISGYFADMTRTICLASPEPTLIKMYEAVLGAQEFAFSLLYPGANCGEIQKEVEQFFLDEGFETFGKGIEFPYAEGFVHGVGHGVGEEIHEAPRIGRGSTDTLEVGDVVTIEPGLYYKAVGGVRIEDMVLITPGGYELLTDFPKQFVYGKK